MSEEKKPLITFLLYSYNQEKYIRKALDGALSQTYSPLEIIISDDCSSDKTFNIIKEVTDRYNGPHHLIVNRNEKNMGLISHFNKLMSMSHGELIINSAGDDFSLPERTQKLYEYWYPQKDTLKALVSSSHTIDSGGNELFPSAYENHENRIETDFRTEDSFHGACAAYSSEIFRIFGDITCNSYEDMIFFRRALLLGNVMFLKDKLVNFRIGGLSTNASNVPQTYTEFIRVKLKQFKQGHEVVKQLIKDCDKLEQSDDLKIKKENLEYVCKVQQNRIKFYESDSFWQRISLLIKLIPDCAIKRKNIIRQFRFKSHHWFRMLRNLLPDSVNNMFYRPNLWLGKYSKK